MNEAVALHQFHDIVNRFRRFGIDRRQIEFIQKIGQERLIRRQFADRFGMKPVFALAICIADERTIHLLIMGVEELEKHLPRAKHGYSLRFGQRVRAEFLKQPFVDYSRWADESIGGIEF